MGAPLPFLPEISVDALKGLPDDQRLDSLVRQLNEWQRQINQSAGTYKNEAAIQMHPQWTDSWTTNSTWTDIEGSFGSVDFDNWEGYYWYFEMIGKTDAGTGHYRLYNITDSEVVSASEITTTSTTFERIRSGIIPQYKGTKEFKIQHRIEGGDGSTEFVNSGMSRIIFGISQ